MGQKYQIYSACDGEKNICTEDSKVAGRVSIIRQQIVTLGFETRIWRMRETDNGQEDF